MKIGMLRIALLLILLATSAVAGELAEVVSAQQSFLNEAKQLEERVAATKNPNQVMENIEGYLRAKKLLQEKVEKNLPELRAQISHQKLPTLEGIELSLQMNEFPANRMKALEETILGDLKKDAVDERAVKDAAELTRLQEHGTIIYKHLM